MYRIKKSILFWSVMALLLLLAAYMILESVNLTPRAWLRESLCVAIALGAVSGIFQLLLKIPVKWLKTALLVVCAVATVIGGHFGWLFLSIVHCPERRGEYNGTPCIIEREDALWGGTYSEFYYEDHGLFVRGTKILHSELSLPD